MAIVVLLIFSGRGSAGESQDLVEKVDGGLINWSTGSVAAQGVGAPPERDYGTPQAKPEAIGAARLDAMQNILEALQGVRIDSKTTVKNFVTESDVVAAEVASMARGAKVVHEEDLSDGTAAVTVEMSLLGGFAQLVLPPEIRQVETVRSIATHGPESGSKSTSASSGAYTGLVIDARGLNAMPAMAPKVTDETGQEVYGPAFVSREFAVQQGMSGYARDIKGARANPRVGDNPLVVKGLRTNRAGGSDILISNADAAKLRSASENLSFLKKCRVMIVVD